MYNVTIFVISAYCTVQHILRAVYFVDFTPLFHNLFCEIASNAAANSKINRRNYFLPKAKLRP